MAYICKSTTHIFLSKTAKFTPMPLNSQQGRISQHINIIKLSYLSFELGMPKM